MRRLEGAPAPAPGSQPHSVLACIETNPRNDFLKLRSVGGTLLTHGVLRSLVPHVWPRLLDFQLGVFSLAFDEHDEDEARHVSNEAIQEIVTAARVALVEQRILIAAAIGVVLAGVLVDRAMRPLSFFARWPVRLFFLLGGLGLGYWRATRALWLCDDAFITFHYADMLARGYGLVINPGEWVEGYTNFLWTVTLAALRTVGFDIPRAGLVLNLAAYGVSVVAIARATREAELEAGRIATVPFGAMVLAAMAPFTTFASSGLETMPAACCVSMALLNVVRRRSLVAGVWFTAATMCRPDHILYGVAFGASLLLQCLWGKRTLRAFRPVFAFSLPFVCIFLPYWLIRWKVYGDFYPNTYYAKSGGLAYWSQGLVYSAHFLATSGLWLVLPVAFVAFLGRASSLLERQIRVGAALSVIFMGLYVTRVGGDFMEFRFYVALLPVLALSCELAFRSWFARGKPLFKGAIFAPLLVATGVAATPVRIIKEQEKKWHLAAEENFYKLKAFSPEVVIDSNFFNLALSLRGAFLEVEPKPRFAVGCIGFVSFYSGLPLIDTYGLANRRIAHKTVVARGRPGHEKFATLEEIVLEGAQLSFDHGYDGWDWLTKATLGPEKMWLLKYKQPWADAIRAAGGTVPDPAAELRQAMAGADRTRRLELLTFFENYLSEEPAREEILRPLRRELGTVEPWDEGPPPVGFVRDASEPRPVGRAGRAHFVSQGRVRSEVVFASVEGQVLRFNLGGPLSDGLSVLVDGEVFRPDGSSTLRLVEHPLRPGKHVLTLIDEDADADLAIDAIRVVAGEAPSLEAFEAMDDAAALNRLRELEPEWASSPVWPRFIGRQAAHWSFDEASWPSGVVHQGAAFGEGPVAFATAGQMPVRNVQGARFANGFLPDDKPQGMVEVRLPTGPRVVVSFLLAGGNDCARVHARIVLRRSGGAEREVARACAVSDEVLRAHTMTVDVAGDEQAFLQFVDASSDGWGHLLFDDVRAAIRL